MSLRVYNTLTQQKENFVPCNPPKVGMYVCGVTVYDLCHIGHARAGIVFDVISRYLRYSGYEVTYVRNITDIDDKIINRANESGREWAEVATTYTAEFDADMKTLGLALPDLEPKATEHIAEMHDMIATLIEKGFAYESGGSVWFSVHSFPEYGKLSNKKLDELISGARVAIEELKRDPLDFALWKASKPGEPFWDSPWGPGRPGWHIECSAMGKRYLGTSFDIHGGGKDLVFPHHENEVAQSHACSGHAPVKYWLHNGFVTVQKEKMSKSLGNFFTIKDLLVRHHPESLRLFLLQSHYRSPIDFADSFLVESYKSLCRFYDLFNYCKHLDLAGFETAVCDDSLSQSFRELMDDDFNTATAVAMLTNELRRLNQTRQEMSRLKKKSDEYKNRASSLLTGSATLLQLGNVLGLFQIKPEQFVDDTKTEKLRELGMSADEVTKMLAARTDARANKDFVTADKIRDEFDQMGLLLHDSPEGTEWSVAIDR